MARSLSSIVLKGIARLPATYLSFHVSGSMYQTGMKYSTTLSNDPDTHEDFRSANKLGSSGLSATDVVEQDLKENPIMIYMKGIPDLPRCGFSSLAVRVLKEYNVPLSARNILEDPELKNAVKAYSMYLYTHLLLINRSLDLSKHAVEITIAYLLSNWPTFPQIFIKGEFIGGSDIILNMHQTGELREKLNDIAAIQEKSS